VIKLLIFAIRALKKGDAHRAKDISQPQNRKTGNRCWQIQKSIGEKAIPSIWKNNIGA
jgi:hypothetical protein